MRMRAPANSTTGRPAVTMLQRPAPTPFVRVLLSVAVYAAVLTMVGRAAVCRAAGELKDACINYEVSAGWGRAVYIIHQLLPFCNM